MNKWEFASQVGSITQNKNADGSNALIVAQPGGTLLKLKCGATAQTPVSETREKTPDELIGELAFEPLVVRQMRNFNVSCEIQGGLKIRQDREVEEEEEEADSTLEPDAEESSVQQEEQVSKIDDPIMASSSKSGSAGSSENERDANRGGSSISAFGKEPTAENESDDIEAAGTELMKKETEAEEESLERKGQEEKNQDDHENGGDPAIKHGGNSQENGEEEEETSGGGAMNPEQKEVEVTGKEETPEPPSQRNCSRNDAAPMPTSSKATKNPGGKKGGKSSPYAVATLDGTLLLVQDEEVYWHLVVS